MLEAENQEQKLRIHNELCDSAATYGYLNNELDIFPYYKVSFSEVLTLIGRRNVYLLDGYAYVPNNRFFNIITGTILINAKDEDGGESYTFEGLYISHR